MERIYRLLAKSSWNVFIYIFSRYVLWYKIRNCSNLFWINFSRLSDQYKIDGHEGSLPVLSTMMVLSRTEAYTHAHAHTHTNAIIGSFLESPMALFQLSVILVVMIPKLLPLSKAKVDSAWFISLNHSFALGPTVTNAF